MKTRILSAAVMIALCIGFLWAGSLYPVALAVFLAVLAALGCYEMLCRAAGIGQPALWVVSMVYAVAGIFAYCGYTERYAVWLTPMTLSVFYVTIVAVLSLFYHAQLSLAGLASAVGFPLAITYGFSALWHVYCRENGLYCLLLLLTFSSICDCGAYFTGVWMGKHKLCPGISPKKTVEGAVGGVIAALVTAGLLCVFLNGADDLVALLIVTIPFCLLGMAGDLFASVIKRSVGLKDYGYLIPGHGGILDRFDSILLIAPVFVFCLDNGIL